MAGLYAYVCVSCNLKVQLLNNDIDLCASIICTYIFQRKNKTA